MSDVEIAVYLSEGEDYIQRKLEILGKLMELLETEEIDLVVLNTTPLTLRMKILENKKVMVDNDPVTAPSPVRVWSVLVLNPSSSIRKDKQNNPIRPFESLRFNMKEMNEEA